MRIQILRATALTTTIAMVMSVTGCASGGGMAASPAPPSGSAAMPGKTATAFPTGRFKNDEMIAVMNTDGSYVGTTEQGEDWVKGSYVVTGDTVALTDSWMIDKYKDNSCVGKGAGRYRWATTETGVSYTLIEDACEARARGLGDQGAWSRIP